MVAVRANRIVAPHDLADQRSKSSVLRDGALVAAVREILARAGIRESCSAEQEGVFFAFESHDEVSLQYNASEGRLSANAASSRKAKGDIFTCCSVLAEHGFAVTLFASARTLALFVRPEVESKATGSY